MDRAYSTIYSCTIRGSPVSGLSIINARCGVGMTDVINNKGVGVSVWGWGSKVVLIDCLVSENKKGMRMYEGTTGVIRHSDLTGEEGREEEEEEERRGNEMSGDDGGGGN